MWKLIFLVGPPPPLYLPQSGRRGLHLGYIWVFLFLPLFLSFFWGELPPHLFHPKMFGGSYFQRAASTGGESDRSFSAFDDGGFRGSGAIDPWAGSISAFWRQTSTSGGFDDAMKAYRTGGRPQVVYCFSQYDCFNLDCTYSHPNEVCVVGNTCKAFDCPDRHSRFRVRRCKDAGDCRRVGCLFLHPPRGESQHFAEPIKVRQKKAKVVKSATGKAGQVGSSDKINKNQPVLKKACRVCENNHGRSSFHRARWNAKNRDLTICNKCTQRFSLVFTKVNPLPLPIPFILRLPPPSPSQTTALTRSLQAECNTAVTSPSVLKKILAAKSAMGLRQVSLRRLVPTPPVAPFHTSIPYSFLPGI